MEKVDDEKRTRYPSRRLITISQPDWHSRVKLPASPNLRMMLFPSDDRSATGKMTA
ncbi:hypothetical protein [Mucilaginibacter sp.]|uniref:hypothetical protein n=1 Tax=Mucilaginibacter sp. TaxID=1882438 RepID=UPI0035688F60